jgi:hypothetical protein
VERQAFSLAVHLLPTKESVYNFNTEQLAALDNPVLRCLAEHHGPGAGQVSEEDAEGLAKVLYLSEGARVMLTRNLWTTKGIHDSMTINSTDSLLGLVNGAQGTVRKIWFY